MKHKKHAWLCFVALALAGCETTFYTPRGILYTSQPSGATIKLDVVAYDASDPNKFTGSSSLVWVTPVERKDDRFAIGLDRRNQHLKFKYVITVSKAGYETIIEEIDGCDMPQMRNWILKPKI